MGGKGFFREGKRSGERNEEVPMKDQTNIIQISKPVSPDPALVTIFGSLYRDNQNRKVIGNNKDDIATLLKITTYYDPGYTQRNLFDILLNQTEIRLYLPFYK